MRESSWQTGSLARAFALGLLALLAPNAASSQSTCGYNATVTCGGDCDGSGGVSVEEIVTMVAAALDPAVLDCEGADLDGDGRVTVDEIIVAVNNALSGCGQAAGVLDPGEECDDGGLCVGGPDAGDPCTAESDCDGDGACFGGLDDLRGCRSNDDCREGTCRKCRPYGGDGCAANCTIETDNAFVLAPGSVATTGDRIEFGTSGAVIFGTFLTVPLPLRGTQVLTTGRIVDGRAPVVLMTSGVDFDAIPVSTIACACIRGATARTCGGTLYDADGVQSANCTPEFNGIAECPAESKCAALHGPGNSGSGFITCGAPAFDIDVSQDCNGIPGRPPYDPDVIIIPPPTPVPVPPDKGSGLLVITSAIGTVVGGCQGTLAEYGPDGQFCSDDDPRSSRGTPSSIPFTTGAAQATIIDSSIEFDIVQPHRTTGAPFSCDGDAISVPGTNLAGAYTTCDQPTVSDIAVVVNLVAE